MARAEELYEQWKKKCPKEVRKDDLSKVLYHYLGDSVREKTKTSHVFIVEHPALASHPAFGGNNTLSISLKSGRSVKGVYVQHMLKAIECVREYERIVNQKENEL